MGILAAHDALVGRDGAEGVLGALVEHLGKGLGGVVGNHDGGAAGAALALVGVPHAEGVLGAGPGGAMLDATGNLALVKSVAVVELAH